MPIIAALTPAQPNQAQLRFGQRKRDEAAKLPPLIAALTPAQPNQAQLRFGQRKRDEAAKLPPLYLPK